jgi:hypothetical protein
MPSLYLSPRPLKEGIFSVSEIFIEDYLRNLTSWEKSKNSAPKSVHYLLGSESNRHNFRIIFLYTYQFFCNSENNGVIFFWFFEE